MHIGMENFQGIINPKKTKAVWASHDVSKYYYFTFLINCPEIEGNLKIVVRCKWIKDG